MHRSGQRLFMITAVVGALAVVLGAFGAHALKATITSDQLAIYKTGVQYHFYHVVLLSMAAYLYDKHDNWLFKYAFYFGLAGIFCFSGSLYLLAMRVPLGIVSWTFLGPITPIGGLLFISSWLMIALGVRKL